MATTYSTAKPRMPKRPAASPSRSSGWKVRRQADLEILVCLRLEKLAWLRHGFSTRRGGTSEMVTLEDGKERVEKILNLGFTEWDRRERVEANRKKFQQAAGAARMALVPLKQIHSDLIRVVDRAPAETLAGDALITAAPGLLLAVQTADCVPILLTDAKRRVVAAIHSGWRGTLKRIAAKTLGRMQMLFGTRPEDVFAALGPAIGPCSYEVGPEVVKEFSSQFAGARDWFEGPFDKLAWGEDPMPLAWLTMMPPGHVPPPPSVQLDLFAANRSILEEAGIPAKNIFTADFCTACRTDLFFSYRREGKTGRLMAVIGIR